RLFVMIEAVPFVLRTQKTGKLSIICIFFIWKGVARIIARLRDVIAQILDAAEKPHAIFFHRSAESCAEIVIIETLKIWIYTRPARIRACGASRKIWIGAGRKRNVRCG